MYNNVISLDNGKLLVVNTSNPINPGKLALSKKAWIKLIDEKTGQIVNFRLMNVNSICSIESDTELPIKKTGLKAEIRK